MQAHDLPPHTFPQRILARQVLGMLDGLRIRPLFLQEVYQPLQRVAVGLRQALAIGCDPIVVAFGQEITRIARDRRLQRLGGIGLLDGVLEAVHVKTERGIGAPLHGLGLGPDEAFPFGQALHQRVQQVAQVGPRLRLG